MNGELHRRPECLFFDYGQRHLKESKSSASIAESLGLIWHIVELHDVGVLIQAGALAGREKVPEAHYSHASQKVTIVPNRNSIMLSIAVGRAAKQGFSDVYYAAHKNDRAIYPDCRKEFVSAFDTAERLANEPPVHVNAPFVDMTKAEVLGLGRLFSVPFEKTWSCYKGGELACGKCGTCLERLEAFQLNGLIDPLKYE